MILNVLRVKKLHVYCCSTEKHGTNIRDKSDNNNSTIDSTGKKHGTNIRNKLWEVPKSFCLYFVSSNQYVQKLCRKWGKL